jgi:hypothetical protein
MTARDKSALADIVDTPKANKLVGQRGLALPDHTTPRSATSGQVGGCIVLLSFLLASFITLRTIHVDFGLDSA